jgi:hypothetical protein
MGILLEVHRIKEMIGITYGCLGAGWDGKAYANDGRFLPLV